MIKASLQNVVDDPWERFEPVRVGNVPIGLNTPAVYVLIENDGTPLLRIDLYGDEDCYAFEDVIIWREFVVIGRGSRVYLVNYDTQKAITVDLDSYFGHFYSAEEWLITASGNRLLLVNPTGRVVWRTEELGLDGVIVDAIKGRVIQGQGEWDPPGGWRTFQVSLDSGEKINESPKRA
jgi:hypothetical protein